MASESREDTGVGFDVPAELHEWLDERAAALGVERQELVVQILSSYHAAATIDGRLDAAELLDLSADDFVDVESAVDEAVDETVTEQVDDALAERVDELVGERVDDVLADRADDVVAEAVADHLDEALAAELDDLDAEFQAKIEDVRERVIQVKREADAKAPADHTHEELTTVNALDERVDALADDLAGLREETTERLDERDASWESLTERLDDAEEKLNRVAWVVSDLKDEVSGRDSHEQAVDRLKRAAVQEGVDVATCERCDETVHVALLTDPECPHCNATVSDVRPAGGIFRKKARLVPAAQLESGEETDDA